MKMLFTTLLCMLLLGACATPHQERAATTGAIVGATAGAVIGSESDRTAEGAVIGGIIGGLAGAVIAGNQERSVAPSEPRYHRRACRKGAIYFERARQARRLERQVYWLREGLRYCPNNPAAHNDLGVALLLLGKPVAARRHFEIALDIDPGYEPARINLRRMHRGKGHYRHGRGHGYGHDKHHDDDYWEDR